MPTTSLSWIKSSLRFPRLQVSARLYTAVIYCSELSPSSCTRLFNLALSKMTFYLTLKCSSNLARTSSYFLSCCSVILVDDKTSSPSSPKQYRSVLIWRVSAAAERPDASRKCWNRLFHRGQSSGSLKLNCFGGSILRVAIVLSLPYSDTMYSSRLFNNQSLESIQDNVYDITRPQVSTCEHTEPKYTELFKSLAKNPRPHVITLVILAPTRQIWSLSLKPC